MLALSLQAFFYPGPFAPYPVSYRLFVPLPRPTFGLLGAETEGTQKATDMVRMIRNPEAVTDQIHDPGTSPQIGRVSEGRSPLDKHIGELLPIFRGQLGRPAGGRNGCQPLESVVMIGSKPAMYRTAIDPELSRYLAGTETFAEELDRFESPLFEGSRISVWSHVSPPEWSMRH